MRLQEDHIRLLDARAQGRVGGAFVRGVRIIKREGFLGEIQDVHGAVVRLQLPGGVADDGADHGNSGGGCR